MKNRLLKGKAIIFLAVLILGGLFWGRLWMKNGKNKTLDFKNAEKKMAFFDDGLFFEVKNSQAGTVSGFLGEQKIKLSDQDNIFPPREEKINSGMQIIIERAKKILALADSAKKESYVFSRTAGEALEEMGINFKEEDIITPAKNMPIKNGTEIKITRVDIKEEMATKPIKFETISKEDNKLSWRKKIIEQKGQNGKEKIKYKVVYHNSKEISRKILARNTVQDPITEIVIQGTYVKTGKARTGQGTWYAWKGGLFAASKTLPRGSYAKVTNVENGKSVIVQINDYGPQGKGRIIDLDKVAFAKIASIGAGVIGVKVELVLN